MLDSSDLQHKQGQLHVHACRESEDLVEIFRCLACIRGALPSDGNMRLSGALRKWNLRLLRYDVSSTVSAAGASVEPDCNHSKGPVYKHALIHTHLSEMKSDAAVTFPVRKSKTSKKNKTDLCSEPGFILFPDFRDGGE